MNYNQFFQDVTNWLNQNNQAAQKFGFGTHEYWQWVVESSGKLCDYYKNNPIAINIMLGLWNYLNEIGGKAA